MKSIMTRSAIVVCLLTVFSSSHAQLDEEAQPYWLEASAYSAELNLSSAELRLIPMVGDELKVQLPHACVASTQIDDGVYAVIQDVSIPVAARDFELYASYPEAADISIDQGNTKVLACDEAGDQPLSAQELKGLRLPAYAMELLAGFDVGAIYLHR